MSSPQLPSETSLRSGETLIEQWDYRLVLHDSPVAEILARAILTSERLMLLELPSASARALGSSGLFRRRAPSSFAQEMGRWHIVLISRLSDLPEPVLGEVTSGGPTALPSRRALLAGGKSLPVGDDPRAEVMVARIREQWAAVRRDSPLR